MIAEYERAQIAERCRRGKLHRARGGAVSVHGPRAIRLPVCQASEHADAFFEIDEAEAPVVREIFRRYLEDDESIAKIARWLSAQGVRPEPARPAGTTPRSGGCSATPPTPGRPPTARRTRPAAPSALPVSAAARAALHANLARGCRAGGVEPDPVPALITEEQFALAQERLHRNSASRRATPAARRCCRASSSAVSAATRTTAARRAARTGSFASTTAAQAPTGTAAPKDASAPTGRSASQRSTSLSGRGCSPARGPRADPGRNRPPA